MADPKPGRRFGRKREAPSGGESWLPFPLQGPEIRPPLTATQKQVLEFIRAYRADHGVSPTLQEIGDRFETHRVTVHAHVNALVKKHFLVRFSRKASRALIPVDELPAARESGEERAGARSRGGKRGLVPGAGHPSAGISLPLVGRIAAGRPIEAVYANESLDLASLFPSGRELFVLEVSGDSMVDEQIRDGDYVVAEKRATARNGEIVVAVLPTEYGSEGEATLKRFFHEGDRIRLQPANPDMSPI